MACEVCKKPYVHSTEITIFDSDKKPHVCVTCGKSFSLKVQLKKHMETHEDGKPYVCHSCEKNNSLTYNLRLQKKANFVCDHCNKVFDSRRMLLQHATEHSLVDECEENFESIADLKKHSVTHKSTKNRNKKQKINHEKAYECNECEKSFSQLSALTKHSVSHMRYQCDLCKARFSLQKELDEHFLNQCHTSTSNDDDAKKYTCSICNKSFARKTSLDGHIISHVNEKSESAPEDDSDVDADFMITLPGEKNNQPKEMCLPKLKLRRSYSCEMCQKVYATEVLLQKHMLCHKQVKKAPDSNDKKKYKCRVCKEAFLNKMDYKQHKLNHKSKGKSKSSDKKEKKYVCDICFTDFTKKKHLKKHKKTHSATNQADNIIINESQRKKSKKRSKNFACGTCGRLFAGEICLRKHELRHKDDALDALKGKKYRPPVNLICPFCNEDFTGRKFSFVRHKLTHTPEICGICDERFVDRAALREHLKTHIGTEEARKFLECSNKAQSLKSNLQSPEGKVEYIYLVLR